MLLSSLRSVYLISSIRIEIPMLDNSDRLSLDRRAYLLGLAGFAGCSSFPGGDSGDPEVPTESTVEDSPGSGGEQSTTTDPGQDSQTQTEPRSGTTYTGNDDFLSDLMSPVVLDERGLVTGGVRTNQSTDIYYGDFEEIRSRLEPDLAELVIGSRGITAYIKAIGRDVADVIDVSTDVGAIERISLRVGEGDIIQAVESEGFSDVDLAEMPEEWSVYQGSSPDWEFSTDTGVLGAFKNNQALLTTTVGLPKPEKRLAYKANVIEGNADSRMKTGEYAWRLSRATEILNNDEKAEESSIFYVEPRGGNDDNTENELIRGVAFFPDGNYEIREWYLDEEGKTSYDVVEGPASIRESGTFG